MKLQLGASDAFFPVPAALIGCGTMEAPNMITIAWISIVTKTPPTIGMSLKKTRHSFKLIKETGEFTVNIPQAKDYKEVDYCGIVSGSDTNKFADINFTPVKGAKVTAPIIKECPYNMECRVSQEIDLGDYVLILGEIVETHIDEDKVTDSKIDIAKVDPLVYAARVRDYWSLGKKIGDGFAAGKRIASPK